MILDKFSLAGKTALVTGASTGIGQAIAIALAEAGATVACHSRADGGCEETIADITVAGGLAVGVYGDVGDPRVPAKLAEDALAKLSRIDILINNAGTIRRAPAVDYSGEDWDAVIEINLSSVFRLSQAVGRSMITNGGGKIVNIASLLSFQGGITVPAYTASKSGVAGLTKAIDNERAKHNINENANAQGNISTNNTASLRADETRNRQILERIPAGRWGKAEDIAGAAVFLSSEAATYMQGHLLVVDGGWMSR